MRTWSERWGWVASRGEPKSNRKLMRKNVIINFWLTAITIALLSATSAAANPRSDNTVSFNQNWRFHLGDVPAGKDPDFNDSQWRQLNLPHDFSIEGRF